MEALVLVDLQKGLCDPEGAAAGALSGEVAARGTLAAAAQCLHAAREQSIEIVHVRLAFDSSYQRRTNRTERFNAHERSRRFLEGSPDTAFCDEVQPQPGELVVNKGSVSPFASTALAAWFHSRGIARLAICGVATHLAVESTAREAADGGFYAAVIGDACAAPDDLHSHALTKTIPAFGEVVTVSDFMRRLAG